MTAYSVQAWKNLARSLRSRRARIDPRFSKRTTFCEATGLHYKLVQDIENAPETRTNFTDETFALIEDAYRLVEGSARRTLSGGPLEPLPTVETAEVPERVTETAEREPESPAAQHFMNLLLAANDQLTKMTEQQNARLDELAAEVREQKREIQELRREQQRKGA